MPWTSTKDVFDVLDIQSVCSVLKYAKKIHEMAQNKHDWGDMHHIMPKEGFKSQHDVLVSKKNM